MNEPPTALVVFSPVLGRAVAHAVELEAFERLGNPTGVEGTRHFAGIGVEQGLHVTGMRGL